MQVMCTAAAAPPLYLIEPGDIRAVSLLPEIWPYRSCVEKTLTWVRATLCQPHGELGRNGPICPYVEQSLSRGLFWLAVFPESNPTLSDFIETLRSYRDLFLQLEPASPPEAHYKAVVVLLPDLLPERVHDIVEAAQLELKPEFVTRGLMIGQFHESCNQPGLWNTEFRPLRSPVPLLAIRHMVRWDAPFLTGDAGSLAAYLSRFGADIPDRLRSHVRDASIALGLANTD
jgi:hypothetical protein